MKRTIALFMPFLALLFLASCGNTQAPAEQSESPQAGDQVTKDWDAAKEAYHDVMSGTFHPAEEGNLEPLKTRYTELSSAAKKWAELPLPENLAGKGLEELLPKLVTESEAIGTVVTTGSEEEITASITALHEVFHEIVGLCEH